MDENNKKIFVTHVNIRQSIFFLLLKLVVLDIVASFVVLIYFTFLSMPFFSAEIRLKIISFNFIYFLILIFMKIFLTLFIVFQWINEYYEITPAMIYHRRGIIWRKEDNYELEHIKSIGVDQGVFGRFLNFGTIRFYDWRLEKYISMYLIHNPLKYLRILKSLIPNANEEKSLIREHVFETDNNSL